MELHTEGLLLRTVTMEDMEEVARMWEFEKGSVSKEEAQGAIAYMQNNHKQNHPGHIHHVCLAVFEKGGESIIGWCGLDGQCNPGQIEIFYMIDKEHRNKGYATQCAKKLIEYAFEDAGIERIHGGCFKDNIPSFRVMIKAGMIQCAARENGDPLFYLDRK